MEAKHVFCPNCQGLIDLKDTPNVFDPAGEYAFIGYCSTECKTIAALEDDGTTIHFWKQSVTGSVA